MKNKLYFCSSSQLPLLWMSEHAWLSVPLHLQSASETSPMCKCITHHPTSAFYTPLPPLLIFTSRTIKNKLR